MKKTFLYQVWQHNKRLFYMMAVFAILTIGTNLMGDEVTPFFVWGMYSAKEEPVQQYSVLQTTINDSIVLNAYDWPVCDTRFYLTSPLAWYKEIEDNGHVDPTWSFLQAKLTPERFEKLGFLHGSLFNNRQQLNSFFTWYARYLTMVTTKPVESIRIDEIKAHYAGPKLVVDSIHLFEQWEKP
ncbi:MAG TPA: hypothetical protein VM187_11055 [Niastella sp.]|nr:hypothetical protein [Niastella sp.]